MPAYDEAIGPQENFYRLLKSEMVGASEISWINIYQVQTFH